MAQSPPQRPLIAIIGATGTGKSQLAVELAKRHNGEVINGDAMQLYAGLPVITNKITAEEQQGIPHHLLGCIGLNEQTWVVGTFVKRALGVIEEIRRRGKVPILVGGTHYYLQSLLFNDRLAEAGQGPEEKAFVKDTKEEWPILQQDTDVLLEELRRVDPVMADRWHPNDRRKIQRSLEIYLQTGNQASEMYAEQRKRRLPSEPTHGEDATALDEPSLRFPTLLLWVHSDTNTLRDRLDKRVDKMLDKGLLDEVQTLNAFAAEQTINGTPVDESRGIWVSIGYKEFKEYVKHQLGASASDAHTASSKAHAFERTQIATRQYAKRQIRWIRIKLVNALADANAVKQLYLLDGSDISCFETNVVASAVELANSFLTASSPLPDPASVAIAATEMLRPARDYDLSAQPSKWVKEHCGVCDVTCVTEEQWRAHMKSKAHRKLVSKRKNEVEQDQTGHFSVG